MNTPITECAMCYSLQPCYDDGEAYICVDRAGCAQRQVENRTPVSHRIAGRMTGQCSICREIKPCHYNDVVERWVCDPCDQAGMERLKQAIFGPSCPSCGDPSTGLCAACRETGEGVTAHYERLLA